jgi:hypothetical protein
MTDRGASMRGLDALSSAIRIYIATVRRDGNLSKPVPLWFTLTPDHSILIQTGRSSWIARRVRRGSPVIVWIGRRNGPAVIGNAGISNDPQLTKLIVDDYRRKYLLAWVGFFRPRQERFDAGQVLAIKITPIRDLPEGFASEPGSRAPTSDKEPPGDRPSPPRHADGVGKWLDALADIVFILTALSSEALAGAIPIYVPVLIACSFAQYAIDSVAISGSSTPVKSRLGHWGGVINFGLVLVLAWTRPSLLPARLVRQASPLLAIFYLAAIFERALNYWTLGALRRDKRDKVGKRNCERPCNI